MPQLRTIEDNTYPAKDRPRRRYFLAPWAAHDERRGRCKVLRQHATSSSNLISTSQTFGILAAASRVTDAFVAAQQQLLSVGSFIVCFFACYSSSICALCGCSGASARCVGPSEQAFFGGGDHSGPSPSSSASSCGIGGPMVRRARSNPRPDGPCALSPTLCPALPAQNIESRPASNYGIVDSIYLAALAAGRAALRPTASEHGIAAASVRARRPHRRESSGEAIRAASTLVVRTCACISMSVCQQ